MPFKSVSVVLFLAITTMVRAQTWQSLCSFNGTNGANPIAALTLGNDGNFYGTTYAGGSGGYGTVFKVTTNGTLTTLVSFAKTNGTHPSAGLTLGNDGNFYGTTAAGGTNGITSGGYGTVFKVTSNGTLTSLASFKSVDGSNPQAVLTLGNDGNFYGTTLYGSRLAGNGTIFQVTTNGTLTTLYSFTGGSDGWYPNALTLGSDGNFYGTTENGGTNGYGTVFKVMTNGTLTTLVSFDLTNGLFPQAALTLGNDGNFYGTTDGGSSGTVFKVTTNGILTTLASIGGNSGEPVSNVTLGSDGNFYGTTYGTTAPGTLGTVFRVTTNGVLTYCFFYFPRTGQTRKRG